MEFLTPAECEEFFVRVGFDAEAVMNLRRVDKKHAANFHYQSRLGPMKRTCELIATKFPSYTTALFWTSCSPWGDGVSSEDDPYRARSEWQQITAFRKARGETRRLYDAPGHLFGTAERDAIALFAEVAIGIGWDSVLAARPNKTVIYFSHDDIVQVQSDKNLSEISEQMTKLGFKRGEFC